MPREEMVTEISVLDSGMGKAALKTVRMRSGVAGQRTDIEVTVAESKSRHRRRRRERRGTRWTRGKLDIQFRTLDAQRERYPRSGTISLSEGAAFGEAQRERVRGRTLSEKQQKIQKTIKGIPFNYFNTVNRLFTRLSIPNQRPYTDYTIGALALSDNGSRIPLSVTGISTALLDLGYSQKDFVVGAKAIFDGDEIVVEPSRSDEQRLNLEHLHAGQGILILEYLALTNRIAHVFTKGPISAEIHKKGLAMCVAVCKNLADSAVALLRTKYERTMSQAGGSVTAVPKKKINATAASVDAAALKSSFSSMLATTGAGVAQLTSLVPPPASKSAASRTATSQKQGVPGSKKLSLAELAKGKRW